MIKQFGQKLKILFDKSRITNIQSQKVFYKFSNINSEQQNTQNSNLDFKSLTKDGIAQYLRQLSLEFIQNTENKQMLANRLNNLEQQAVNHLSLNQDDTTNLILILQIMLQNNRESSNILSVTHTILQNIFNQESDQENMTKSQIDKKVQVFQQIMPLVVKSDKFDYDILLMLYRFFEQDSVFSKFTPSSQLQILKIFFSKGIVRIPTSFNQVEKTLSLGDVVDLMWMKVLSDGKINSSFIEQLSNNLENQPSLKNIPKSIQYKLKEISISQDLGESKKYIKQLDEFLTVVPELSPIQEDLEIILKVLKWNFKSEVLLDPYTVDFVVDIPSSKKKVVIEMNGPSHYPYFAKRDILTSKDQMKIKNLIFQNYSPVMIHHQDWSSVKGVTGKMDFIRKTVYKELQNQN